MIAIEGARPEDRPAIEGLLSESGLPTAGLELALESAVVARLEKRIVGCAAVEPYGTVGLLRSVCVEASLRGSGLGQSLVARAEALARGLGIRELYLLTETAPEWFPRLGYLPGDRSHAPAALSASPEFTGACAESAQLFRKDIQAARDPG